MIIIILIFAMIRQDMAKAKYAMLLIKTYAVLVMSNKTLATMTIDSYSYILTFYFALAINRMAGCPGIANRYLVINSACLTLLFNGNCIVNVIISKG